MTIVASNISTKPKSSIINVRVDSGIKEQSEQILEQMGFSMSGAVNSFLRQVIIERRLPYQPTARRQIISEDNLTKDELDALLVDAANKVTSTSGTPADQFFKELSEEYGTTV